jgi:hypothetical protein
VALTREEQRLLEEIEAALRAEQGKSNSSSGGSRRHRMWVLVACSTLGILAGLALLIAGIAAAARLGAAAVVLSAAGYMVMVATALAGTRVLRSLAPPTKSLGPPTSAA